MNNDFAEFKNQIEKLKGDKHFNKLYNDFDVLDKQIHKIEKDVNHHTDTEMENLKKQRIKLKDELLKILENAA